MPDIPIAENWPLIPEVFTLADIRTVFGTNVVIYNKDNMSSKTVQTSTRVIVAGISGHFAAIFNSFKTWNFDKELVFGVQLDGIWIFGVYFEILGNKSSE